MLLFKWVINDFFDGIAQALIMLHKQAIFASAELLSEHRSFALARVRIEPAAFGQAQNCNVLFAFKRDVSLRLSLLGFRLLGLGLLRFLGCSRLLDKFTNSNEVNRKVFKLSLFFIGDNAVFFFCRSSALRTISSFWCAASSSGLRFSSSFSFFF